MVVNKGMKDLNGHSRTPSWAQSKSFFEARYRESTDPWRFASSQYELGRYDATLAALRKPTYRLAYEPGCSVGVLTAALAVRCRQILACDISAEAVSLARARCKDFAHVKIIQRDLAGTQRAPADAQPEEAFDLIILSEVGYYFSAPTLRRVALELARRLEPGGEFLAVHWLGHSADHVLHGDEVHAVLAAELPCLWTGGSAHPGFRIDSWRRPA